MVRTEHDREMNDTTRTTKCCLFWNNCYLAVIIAADAFGDDQWVISEGNMNNAPFMRRHCLEYDFFAAGSGPPGCKPP